MAIDKESNGVPEIDVHRRTTKVNFTTIIGVLVFFLVGAAAVVWFVHHTP